MNATEEALLRALWGALDAQDVSFDNGDNTWIDGHFEKGQLAFNIISRLSANGIVLVPKPTLESLSWQYDASHMIYFCPWCQQTGSAEPAVHSPDCELAAMIAAASQGEGG